jgi:hypothetical protein
VSRKAREQRAVSKRLKSYIAATLATVMVSASVSQAASVDPAAGTYFFRHKLATSSTPTDTDTSKDITAFFVGGVGYGMDERLPMKPDWEDDAWSVTRGLLPDGISFDSKTRTFKGTPDRAGHWIANLAGRNSNGEVVGEAEVTFDVYAVNTTPIKVELYAHTNHYKLDQLPLPAGVVVDTWKTISPLPTGITLAGRNVEGTPVTAGTTPLFVQGYDYLGREVASFMGRYVVEGAPTFPHIADMVMPIPSQTPLVIAFGAPSTFTVNYGVQGLAKVKYFLEVQPGDVLPDETAYLPTPPNANLRFETSKPYQTATVRFKAIDYDGVVGYSNWFEYGASDPTPDCSLSGTARISFVTGKSADAPLPLPPGSTGEVRYHLVSGSLPDGISLNATTGRLHGVPMVAAAKRDLEFRIDVSNGGNVVSTSCQLVAEVLNGTAGFADLNAFTQAQHIRSGASYTGGFKVIGGIPDYEVLLEGDTWGLSETSPTANAETITVSGTVGAVGLPLSVNATLKNGDGNGVTAKAIDVFVYSDLNMGPVPDFEFKRLAEVKQTPAFAYEVGSVIPDVTGVASYPVFDLDPSSGTLPEGIFVVNNSLSGATSAVAGSYGPYKLRMRDFSGESVTSNAFNIEVSPRDNISIALGPEPKFVFGSTNQTIVDFGSAIQPSGAKDFEQTWSLQGNNVPAWLSVDRTTGKLVASAAISYSEIGKHGPFTLTVIDSEGFSDVSDAFEVEVTDRASPVIKSPPRTIANVTGVEGAGERATFVSTPDLRGLIDRNTIAGDFDAVRFSASGSLPDGTALDPITGVISGEPTEEFNADITLVAIDAEGRTGTILVGISILPYPRLAVPSTQDIPRLSDGQGIVGAKPNSGYFGNPAAFALATGSGPLPQGLTIGQTGGIEGRVTAGEGTYPGIRIVARDAGGSNITGISNAFSITVTPRMPLGFSYGNITVKYLFTENGNGSRSYSSDNAMGALPLLAGSAAGNVVYSIISTVPDDLEGVMINPATGVLIGHPPQLGRWTATVRATDTEGQSANVELPILATLEGSISIGNPMQGLTVRSGQSFHTAPLDVHNAVGDVVYSLNGQTIGADLDFNPLNGAFSPLSKLFSSEPLQKDFNISAKDEHERGFAEAVTRTVRVVPPIEVDLGTVGNDPVKGRQYDASNPINLKFHGAVNGMADIAYDLLGDMPGTLVRKDPTPSSMFRWTDNGITKQSSDPLDLPSDALVFDAADLSLKGIPSRAGAFQLRLKATDSHLNNYEEQSDATRVTYNTGLSPALDFQIASALPFKALASANPRVMLVNEADAALSVTASHNAYGEPVTFAVSGDTHLPPGVVYERRSDGVYFTGKATQVGEWSGFTVRGVDALGATSTVSLTFKVITATDAIVLNVGPIKTKVGFPFSMLPTSSNTYGALRYYSSDLSGVLAQSLSIAAATGEIVMKSPFTSIMQTSFNLSVADETSRLTSKSVSVEVMPVLRVTVPLTVALEQGKDAAFAVDTDYVAGTASYSKGTGTWPAGLDVNPQTGAIVGNPTGGTGTYPGLTIKGIDIIGSQSDIQMSNTFSIKIDPISAAPAIADIFGKQIFKVGIQRELVPTVVDSLYVKPWKYEGTTYSLNKALPGGLQFDSKTGRIFGPATGTGFVTGLTITVTSQRGDSDTTAPFWLGARPSEDLSLSASTRLAYALRLAPDEYRTIESDAPSFENLAGDLTFEMVTPRAGSYSIPTYPTRSEPIVAALTGIKSSGAIFGNYSGKLVDPAVGAQPYPLLVRGTDAYGQTVDIPYHLSLVAGATVAYSNTTVGPGQSLVLNPVKANIATGQSFSINKALPTGVALDPATGIISSVSGMTFASAGVYAGYVVTMTDDLGSATSAQFTITVTAPVVSYSTTLSVADNVPFTANPTLSGVSGNTVFSINKALPNDLSLDPSTGKISGTFHGVQGSTYTGYVVTATNEFGSVQSNEFSFDVRMGARKMWKWQCNSGDNLASFGLAEIQLLSGGTNVTSAASVKSGSDYGSAYSAAKAVDGNTATHWSPSYNGTTNTWNLTFTFATPRDVNKIVLTKYLGSNALNCLSWTVSASDDGATWDTVWTDSYSAWNNTTNSVYTSTKP